MDAGKSQALIVEKLSEALSKDIPSKLFICVPSPEAIPGGFAGGSPRLDMVLSGRIHVSLRLDDGPAELKLREGEAFYAPTGAWERQFWSARGEMLCVVPNRLFLRVSYYNQTNAKRRPEAIYFHTMRLCPAPLTTVSSLLDGRALRSFAPAAAIPLARAMIEMAFAECRLPPAASKGEGAELYESVLSWTEDHFQERLRLDAVAKRFGVSANYVEKLFKRFAGCGFSGRLTEIRMELARYLLSDTEMDLKLVASQCGFSNPVHFVRRFRELNGLPPILYRKSSRRSDV